MSKNKPFKIEKIYCGLYEYRKIKAYQARNWDGSFAGYERGTPDGDQELIERKFIPKDCGLKVRYTNYW